MFSGHYYRNNAAIRQPLINGIGVVVLRKVWRELVDSCHVTVNAGRGGDASRITAVLGDDFERVIRFVRGSKLFSGNQR